METMTALLFTIYMIPVNLLDNILRPLVMARGLETPMLIILIGVIGGTISYGITGLLDSRAPWRRLQRARLRAR